MALFDSLVSYWKCDEASGNLLDSRGSNTLTDFNTVGSAAGKIGNAREFVATNSEYFNIADNTDLSTGDIDFTFSAWVYTISDAADRVILAKVSAAGTFEYLLRYVASSQKLQWFVFDSSGVSTNVLWIATASTSTWYHVVAWHDAAANQIGIAVNAGTPVTASHTTGVRDGTGGFSVGREGDRNSDYWFGRIDEVGFWKGRVLTSDERTALYNGGGGLSYSAFVGGPRRRRVLLTRAA